MVTMEVGQVSLRWTLLVLILCTSLSQTTESTHLPTDWCNGKDVRRFYQHPDNCFSYVICRRGEGPLVMSCYYGLLFDEKTQTCNHGPNVECNKQTGTKSNSATFERGIKYEKHQSHRDAPVYLRHKELIKEVDEAGDKQTGSLKELSFEDKMARIRGEMAYIMPHIRVHSHIFYSNLSSMAKTHKGHKRAFRYVQSFLGNQPAGHKMSYTAFEQLEFLKDIKLRYGLSKTDMRYVMRRLGRLKELISENKQKVHEDIDTDKLVEDGHTCPFSEATDNDCDMYGLYRSQDGSCNNEKHPLWGRAMLPLLREVEPDYEDGISEPRSRGVSGRPLAGARRVSWYTMPDVERPSHTMTGLHMTFGQLLDHDIGRTAMTMIKDKDTGKLVNVECGRTGCETEGPENAACLPIPLPEGDPAFGGHKSCLMFVRSQEVLAEDCSLGARWSVVDRGASGLDAQDTLALCGNQGPRQQLNQVTSYLDASFVYGSSLKQANRLRDLSDPTRGKLKLTQNEEPTYRGLLPQTDHPDCRDFTTKRRCFLAGDTRVNEQVALMSIHTIFHRYHNELEERLFMLNPEWGGDRLYQETRRILGAIWQHIVYNEYLPSALGETQMRRHGLTLHRHGYFNAYDDSVNADAGNAFQTAAFRYGHSQITNSFHLANRGYHKTDTLHFSEVFNRPTKVYENYKEGYSGIDTIMLGQVSQAASDSDPFFSDEITTKLFSENPPTQLGTDLPALNIQRGRDHGLPGYMKFREWCGLRTATTFGGLADIPESSRERLRRAYEHVADIDLFPGAMLEKTLQGSLLGPTFSCIIGRQFRRLRVGDRFWYERQDPITGFTHGQLGEIRKMTLSRIMCDTMDHVDTIQKFALLQPFTTAMKKYRDANKGDVYTLASLYKGDKNERRPCSELPQLDLSYWRNDVQRRKQQQSRHQYYPKPWWNLPYVDYAWH